MSCNQLVRVLGPLCLDLAACKGRECAQDLFGCRLLAGARGSWPVDDAACTAASCKHGSWSFHGGAATQKAVLEAPAAPETVACVVEGGSPGQDWSLSLVSQSGATRLGLESSAVALPPLSSPTLGARSRYVVQVLQAATSKIRTSPQSCSTHPDFRLLACARPWQEIMAGVDWMQNATWLVHVHREAGEKLELTVGQGSPRVFWQAWPRSLDAAQEAGGADAEAVLRLGSVTFLARAHHGLVRCRLPRPGFHRLLFGLPHATPWRVWAAYDDGRGKGADAECRGAPLLVFAVGDGSRGLAVGSPTAAGQALLRLWSSAPGPLPGVLLVISHPDCPLRIGCGK